MDSKRAANYLREARAGNRELREAEELGAQALEALAWVERNALAVEQMDGGYWRVWGPGIGQEGTTPLAAVLDAMSKEKACQK